jgi:histidinol-phosphate aminotransferase
VTHWRDRVPEVISALAPYELVHIPGIDVKLDANENPFPLPREIQAELGAELAKVALNRYPDGKARALRDVIASQTPCRESQLVFGNGSDELITMIIAAFARAMPGRRLPAVAYPVPTFVVFRQAALAHGLEVVEVRLNDQFMLDGDVLHRAIVSGKPNVLFLALPNNPTGTLWDRGVLERALRDHPDVIIVADEAYLDYSGANHLDLLKGHQNLIVMRTLSKLGLAGLRVGYLIADEELVREIDKVRAPYNVGSLNQTAAVWLLERYRAVLEANCAKVCAERDRLSRELAGIPNMYPFASKANLVLFRVGQAGDGRATSTWRRLAERGVLVRNFDRPGPLAGCLRVTVGQPHENDRFLEALRA